MLSNQKLSTSRDRQAIPCKQTGNASEEELHPCHSIVDQYQVLMNLDYCGAISTVTKDL